MLQLFLLKNIILRTMELKNFASNRTSPKNRYNFTFPIHSKNLFFQLNSPLPYPLSTSPSIYSFHTSTKTVQPFHKPPSHLLSNPYFPNHLPITKSRSPLSKSRPKQKVSKIPKSIFSLGRFSTKITIWRGKQNTKQGMN